MARPASGESRRRSGCECIPDSRFHDLDGWRARALHWSGDASRPVLLLHGFMAHAPSWQHLAASLVPSHEVVALDQRGHGRSDATAEFGSRPMVRDVGRLLDDLGWDTVSLVGQSMGGINAFLFAAAKPARVDRLVVIDVGPEIAPEGAQRVRRTASGPAIFASIDDALAQARESFPRADPGLLERRVRHNLVAMPNRRWRWRTDASLLDGTATPDDHTVDERWDAWRAITCPTLLVHGVESDVLTSPLVDAMVDARVAPGLEVVEIAGAGHPVPLDQPDALAAAVGAFLDASAVL